MAEFLIYRTQQGDYHWYLVADNGSKVAGSERGFETVQACGRSIRELKEIASAAPISDRTETESIVDIQEREIGSVPAAQA